MDPLRKQNKRDVKREELREILWPGSAVNVWDAEHETGYTVIPRVLPLVMHLIKILSKKTKSGDPSPAYLELWSKDFGQGMVTIYDEEKVAYAAGYSSRRAVRTWKEHMLKLREIGFIKYKSEGNREFAHVLIPNPLSVCLKLKNEGRVPEEWWTAFTVRAAEIKATIRPLDDDTPEFWRNSTGGPEPTPTTEQIDRPF